MYLYSLVVAFRSIAPLPSWAFYLGIFLMILGIVIRQWSIAMLGRFFSADAGTQKGQKVVKNRSYKRVRHLSYTGVILTLVGIGLALQSGAAVIVIILGFGFGYRIHLEEELLISELGEEYIQYMKNTKKTYPVYLVNCPFNGIPTVKNLY